MNVPSQNEFDFSQPGSGDGLSHWRTQRERAATRLARKLGLPLGREVEVRLKDGVVLRGLLRLKEETLFLETADEQNFEFAIGRATFHHSDIESCVRMD